MNAQLTGRQQEFFRFIVRHIQTTSLPPTTREMQRGFRLRSPRGVREVLEGIARKGWIQILPRLSRGIRVLRGPCPFCGHLSPSHAIGDPR